MAMMTRHTLALAATILVGTALVLPASAQTADNAANAQAIEELQAGRRDTANAAWWGFHEEDSTEALQAAINSGAKKLLIPNMGKPWIVRPIKLVSNQEITFEKGAEVLAKKGEFRGKHDSLFTGSNLTNLSLIGYGATLRMHKADYHGEGYEKAEWRMGIALRGCENVKIYGLTIRETGGDGIYLGTSDDARGACRNVHIKDVVCDANNRQGISVIGASDLLIEDCIFRNTKGTAPEAGLDLEPNAPNEKMSNVVVRNCVAENNNGGGFYVYLLPQDGTSDPVSILFDRCRVTGGRWGLIVGGVKDVGPGGSIEFRDCTVEGTREAGIYVYDKSALQATTKFVNCVLRNVATGQPLTGPKDPPVSVPVLVYLRRPQFVAQPGGVEFINCVIEDEKDRPFLAYRSKTGDFAVSNIRGDITVRNPAGAKTDPAGVAEGLKVTLQQ